MSQKQCEEAKAALSQNAQKKMDVGNSPETENVHKMPTATAI